MDVIDRRQERSESPAVKYRGAASEGTRSHYILKEDDVRDPRDGRAAPDAGALNSANVGMSIHELRGCATKTALTGIKSPIGVAPPQT
jgi:hypothetical protein